MRIISSLEKGIRLLEYIATRGSVRLAETARHFEMSNSNMSIFMNTLLETGLVYKDEQNKKYHISTRIRAMAMAAGNHMNELIEIHAREEMAELHKEFNENVLLAALSGTSSQYIARIQSNHLVQIVDNDENRYPLHATANGKVILAFKDPEFIRRYMDTAQWQKFTDQTIASRQGLEKELSHIRDVGYAINRGEYEESIMAIAVPIESDMGIVASLVVQYPKFRHSLEEVRAYAPDLLAAAKRISDQLKTSP
jgi:DNA-binding IclR family transcriptional regulator